jgi:hypothetical protein
MPMGSVELLCATVALATMILVTATTTATAGAEAGDVGSSSLRRHGDLRRLRPVSPTRPVLSNSCLLIARHVQIVDSDEDGKEKRSRRAHWDCHLHGEDIKASGREIVEIIGLAPNFRAKSGQTTLFADGAEFVDGTLRVGGLKVTTQSEDSDRRRLTRSLGAKKVLVVRVGHNAAKGGAVTSASADVLLDKIFGTSGDALNLRTGYAACSHGELIFDPYVGTINKVAIPNGVLEVAISVPPGKDEGDSTQAMIDAVEKMLGLKNLYRSSLPGVDHVMLIVPPHTQGGW